MWVSVVIRALLDAHILDKQGSKASKPQDLSKETEESLRNRQQARAWFEGNGRWFRSVCDMAGFNPDVVHAEAMQCIENGTTMKRTGKYLVTMSDRGV